MNGITKIVSRPHVTPAVLGAVAALILTAGNLQAATLIVGLSLR